MEWQMFNIAKHLNWWVEIVFLTVLIYCCTVPDEDVQNKLNFHFAAQKCSNLEIQNTDSTHKHRKKKIKTKTKTKNESKQRLKEYNFK